MVRREQMKTKNRETRESKQTALKVGRVLLPVFGWHEHAANRLSEKATKKQNAQNHYDSDYNDLDQAHNHSSIRTKSRQTREAVF